VSTTWKSRRSRDPHVEQIHDLDLRFHKSEEGVAFRLGQLDGGGYRALADLKAVGEIAAIGAGINLKGMIPRFLER